MSLGYSEFLRDAGITEEYVQQVTHSVPFIELNDDNCVVAESDIDGMGLFAKSMLIGTSISMCYDGLKTEAGRYVNHSDNPNAEMFVVNDNNIELIATRNIENEEITIDYRKSNGAKQVARARADILGLEASMKQMDGYDPEGKEICRIKHYHAPGLYGREMWMPKDCLITGKIHLTEHICVLSKGRVTVSSGGESTTYEAPTTIVSKVGAKRAIYAHEESVWTNFHATELTSPEEIEGEIIAETFEELDLMLEHEELKRISK